MTKDFVFDAILSYDRGKYKKKEIKALLSFIKDLTLEINELDYTKVTFKGFSKN